MFPALWNAVSGSISALDSRRVPFLPPAAIAKEPNTNVVKY
jgi:hypothetical protein